MLKYKVILGRLMLFGLFKKKESEENENTVSKEPEKADLARFLGAASKKEKELVLAFKQKAESMGFKPVDYMLGLMVNDLENFPQGQQPTIRDVAGTVAISSHDGLLKDADVINALAKLNAQSAQEYANQMTNLCINQMKKSVEMNQQLQAALQQITYQNQVKK